MIYNEIKEDLFKNKNEYYLAHCISKDFALGAGIAKDFNKLLNILISNILTSSTIINLL